MRQLMQFRNLPQLKALVNSFNGVQIFERNYVTSKISLYCRPQVIKSTHISSGFVGSDTFTEILRSSCQKEGEGRTEVKLWDNVSRGFPWVGLSD